MKKLLIAVEGSDGAGKETQSFLLKEWFVKSGRTVGSVSFPRYKQTTGGWFLWEALKGPDSMKYNFAKLEPYAASLPYTADRRESLPFLRDLIERSDVVIFDRYVESNLLHQGGKFSTDEERERYGQWLFNLEYGMLGLPPPHVVVYLKVPFSISQERAQKRAVEAGGQLDAVERDADYVRKGYEGGIFYAEKYAWEIVECVEGSCELTREEVHAKVVAQLTRRLGL